jgi:hypothetical protein
MVDIKMMKDQMNNVQAQIQRVSNQCSAIYRLVIGSFQLW